jgi:hypothetical protein
MLPECSLNVGRMYQVPEQLQEGMVVALVVVTAPPAAAACAAPAGGGGGGGWWSPAVAVAAAVAKRRSVSFDLPAGDGNAPSEAKVPPEAGAGAEEVTKRVRRFVSTSTTKG